MLLSLSNASDEWFEETSERSEKLNSSANSLKQDFKDFVKQKWSLESVLSADENKDFFTLKHAVFP